MNSAPRELRSNLGPAPTQSSGLVASLDSVGDLQSDSGQKARIFVVEDHPFVREGIVALINRQADLTCCGEADSIASTPSVTAELQPNLVLLDLRLKDGEAFELIKTLKLQAPAMAVLILSQCDEALYAERALRVGAKGYIMKQEAVEELLTAIRTVLRGKVYLSRAMAGRLLDKLYAS